MFGKVTQTYIVVTVCLIIQLPEINAVNLYRCRMPDGSIELNSTGCTNGKLEKSYQYKGGQNSQQKNMPTKSPATFEESIQRSADQSARQLGFRDFDELLSVQQHCVTLFSNQTQIGASNCSLQDSDCFQREANRQMEETNRLMNSTEWYSNRCDKIPWGAFTATDCEAANDAFEDAAGDLQKFSKRLSRCADNKSSEDLSLYARRLKNCASYVNNSDDCSLEFRRTKRAYRGNSVCSNEYRKTKSSYSDYEDAIQDIVSYCE